MKDTDWEILYRLYETPNMTKVADMLYISQPSLTKRVKNMEKEFGVKIINRTSKGVKFTSEGEYLAKKAKEYMEFIKNVKEDVKDLVKKYGLRNSQLLTIPPTGSISTMLGVSGGIEPMFNLSYFRKTESLHNEDVYYKVYTPIVKEYMDINEITNEEDLGDIFVTAMNLKPEERIKMQKAWQINIDASISSTINLPYEATVEDVYNIYVSAWKNNLKGITIYRDGCKRSGVLLNEKPKENKKDNSYEEIEKEEKINEEETEKFVCPECGNESIIPTGGCGICLQCGYSKCN